MLCRICVRKASISGEREALSGPLSGTPMRSESSMANSPSIKLLPPVFPSSAPLIDARHNLDAGIFYGFGKAVEHLLRHLILRSTIGPHLLFDGDGLGDTDAGRLSASASASARICAACCTARWYSALPSLLCTTMLSSDSVIFCCCWARACLAQFALFDRSFLLAGIGFDLLLGNLPRAQLGEDIFDLHITRRCCGVPISTSSSSRL